MNLQDLPEQYRAEMAAYINDGVRPGPFIEAILDNNLRDALSMVSFFESDEADAMELIKHLVDWIGKNAPVKCFGNVNIVERWVARQGLNGMAGKLRSDFEFSELVRESARSNALAIGSVVAFLKGAKQ